jgi:HEAT repeat protein
VKGVISSPFAGAPAAVGWVLVVLCACSRNAADGAAPTKDTTMPQEKPPASVGVPAAPSPAGTEQELQMHITFLMDPLGDAPNVRQRYRSMEWLVAHADLAYPRLLAMLKANPTALDAPSIIEALPHFGRADSIPVLEDSLNHGVASVSSSAGDALGRHPDPSARAALLRALASPRSETLIAAVDGLSRRADPSTCTELLPLLKTSDPVLRSSLIRATATLGCLSQQELGRYATSDPDEHVRTLARELSTR